MNLNQTKPILLRKGKEKGKSRSVVVNFDEKSNNSKPQDSFGEFDNVISELESNLVFPNSSVYKSHSPSSSSEMGTSSGLATTPSSMPMMDSQPLIHDGSDEHDEALMEANRPRASSSPASAQLSVRALPKLNLPATASVNLYPTAPSKFQAYFCLCSLFVLGTVESCLMGKSRSVLVNFDEKSNKVQTEQ